VVCAIEGEVPLQVEQAAAAAAACHCCRVARGLLRGTRGKFRNCQFFRRGLLTLPSNCPTSTKKILGKC
jgi:hypothetical protein